MPYNPRSGIYESPWRSVGENLGESIADLIGAIAKKKAIEKEQDLKAIEDAYTRAQTNRDTTELTRLMSMAPEDIRNEARVRFGISPEIGEAPAPVPMEMGGQPSKPLQGPPQLVEGKLQPPTTQKTGGGLMNVPQSPIQGRANIPFPMDVNQFNLAAGYARAQGTPEAVAGLPSGLGVTPPEVAKAESDKETARKQDALRLRLEAMRTAGGLEPNQQEAAFAAAGLGNRIPPAEPRATKPGALPLSTIMDNFKVTPQQAGALWSMQEKGFDIGPMLATLPIKPPKPTGEGAKPTLSEYYKTWEMFPEMTEEQAARIRPPGVPTGKPVMQKTQPIDENTLKTAVSLAGSAKSNDIGAFLSAVINPTAPESIPALAAAATGMINKAEVQGWRTSLDELGANAAIAKKMGDTRSERLFEEQFVLTAREGFQKHFHIILPEKKAPWYRAFIDSILGLGSGVAGALTHGKKGTAPGAKKPGEKFNPLE